MSRFYNLNSQSQKSLTHTSIFAANNNSTTPNRLSNNNINIQDQYLQKQQQKQNDKHQLSDQKSNVSNSNQIPISYAQTAKSSQNIQNKSKILFPKINQSTTSSISPDYLKPKDKQKIFEKLKKRTLRSKVLSLMDEVLTYYCCKLAMDSKRDEELTEIKKRQKVQEYQSHIKKEDFLKRKLVFTKYNKNEFVYSVPQNRYNKELDESLISQKQPTFLPHNIDQLKQAKQVIIKICKHLTLEEILEIGEDPAYFIVKEEHRRNKELLNPHNWTEIGISMKDKEKQNNKQKNQHQSQLLQNQNSLATQRSYNIQISQQQLTQNTDQDDLDNQILTSNNNTLNSPKYNQFNINDSLFMSPINRIPNPEIFNDNGKLRKQKIQQEKFDQLKQNHEKRFKRWQEKNSQENLKKQEKRIKFLNDHISKQNQTENYIEDLQKQKDSFKQLKKEQELKQIEQFQEKRRFIEEDDDIFLLQEDLRSMCLNISVKKQKENGIQDKIQKIQKLRKFQQKTQENIQKINEKQLQRQRELQESILNSQTNNNLTNNNISNRLNNYSISYS